jgi:hypothetical protein
MLLLINHPNILRLSALSELKMHLSWKAGRKARLGAVHDLLISRDAILANHLACHKKLPGTLQPMVALLAGPFLPAATLLIGVEGSAPSQELLRTLHRR